MYLVLYGMRYQKSELKLLNIEFIYMRKSIISSG